MARTLFITSYAIVSAGERHRIYVFPLYLERTGFGCVVRPCASTRSFRAMAAERLAPEPLVTLLRWLRRVFQLSVGPPDDAHRNVSHFTWTAAA